MKAKELTGKVALITGASKGLGKAMALALAEAGAKLALVSRDERLLTETAADITALGAEAAVFPADVSDEIQV
ncbi:MAG: SDR family NAD(P)-dependent oxidoreductase, partial [Methylotetracoccus sp.]|nr:SDR family NAD(P)-dependent oxidoreductase [Methylotetracoccus sp.]